MEQATQEAIHYTTPDEKWPTGLKKAEDVAASLGVSVERVKELAEAHFLPHWRIDGGEPLFQITECKRWAAKNMLNRFEGQPLPVNIRVMAEPPPAQDPPEVIREIANLRQFPPIDCVPGVYFLVEGAEVVYVGQSINPLARIAAHTDKRYDRVYVLPVPSSALLQVEGALIRALKPVLNRGANGKRLIAGGNATLDDETLAEFVR